MNKTTKVIFAVLIIICNVIVVFGVSLYSNPYLLAKNQESEGTNLWTYGSDLQALILFNFSSRGLITANYPVSIAATVYVANQTLLSFLQGKRHVEMDISGTYSYPIQYGMLGIYEGVIRLQSEGNNIFQGNSEVIFPHTGSSYYYSIFAFDLENDTSPPIYTMNVTDIEHAIPPTFEIDEGYAVRTSYEQANQNTALSITTVGLTGLTIVLAIALDFGKKSSKELEHIVTELDNIREKVNLIQQYQKQVLELEQKHRKN